MDRRETSQLFPSKPSKKKGPNFDLSLVVLLCPSHVMAEHVTKTHRTNRYFLKIPWFLQPTHSKCFWRVFLRIFKDYVGSVTNFLHTSSQLSATVKRRLNRHLDVGCRCSPATWILHDLWEIRDVFFLREICRYTSVYSATLSPCTRTFHHFYCTHILLSLSNFFGYF